jgi:hypothetical protein
MIIFFRNVINVRVCEYQPFSVYAESAAEEQMELAV